MLIRIFNIIAVASIAIFALSACQKAVEFTKLKSDADVPRINTADAKKEYDAGSAVFIDSRQEASFAEEHIAGAINIPFGAQDAMGDKITKGKKIIIYCS